MISHMQCMRPLRRSSRCTWPDRLRTASKSLQDEQVPSLINAAPDSAPGGSGGHRASAYPCAASEPAFDTATAAARVASCTETT